MRGLTLSRHARAIAVVSVLGATSALAQGMATSAIRGSVRADDGMRIDGVSLQIRNLSTGVVSATRVRAGRYLIQGLETGGPYVVAIRGLGFVSQKSQPVTLTLGPPAEVDFVLKRTAVTLDTVTVKSSKQEAGGTITAIGENLLHSLPTLNRNVFDFIPLAPAVSTKVGAGRTGLSAAGANLRFNNFLINGADERAVNGNVSSGINGGKSIPIDAVREYQVLIAPYDVRYGDFAGGLVNTVTRSGTNEIDGSAFTFWRNNELARGGPLAPSEPYERFQTGFTIGGPIIRDRLHFFVAPEFQRVTSPAPGAFIGQPENSAAKLRVGPNDIARLGDILSGYGLESGSAAAVTNISTLRNIFARLDAAAPRWNSRVIAFTSDAYSDDSRFTRSARDTFYLSTYRFSAVPRLRLTSVQMHTDFPGIPGGHNELIVSHIDDGQDFIAEVKAPLVRVLVPAADGGSVTVSSGTAESAQGRFTSNSSLSVKDELSFSFRNANTIVLGAQAEAFRIQRGGVASGYGVWTFSSLDSLARGDAERYELRKDLGSADARLDGRQFGAYVSNAWRPTQRLLLTGGVRADAMVFSSHAPFNEEVDSIFGRRTDQMPRARIHWSPRIGFAWDIGESGSQLRGGIGIFTGRPPKAWYASAITSYGIGTGVLKCGPLQSDGGLPPDFSPDYRNAPTSCKNGPPLTVAPRGDVDLLGQRLHMAQTQRASIAYDYRAHREVFVSFEALMSRSLADFVFVNLNLKGPQSTDAFGRVLYGTIGANGIAVPAVKSAFSEVIDLQNTSRNYSYQLIARAEKRFARSSALASYTYSRVRDVQSPSRVNVSGTAIWADARAISGRHDDMGVGISLNDRPHRVVVALTHTLPWRRTSTDFSFFYVGESGSPFTYLAYGASRRGDLNADGSNANDPVYVPIDAMESGEIIFSGRSDAPDADNSVPAQVERVAAQQSALNSFIDHSACLRRQRGRILARNSCREPMSHSTIAGMRQAFRVGGHALEAGLDVFNVLNLINAKWGLYRVAEPRLLEHAGHTPGPPESAQGVFRFDAERPQFTTLTTESAFQLQIGLRYRF